MATQRVIIVQKGEELFAFGSIKKASEIFKEINPKYVYKKYNGEDKFNYKGLIIHKLDFY